MSKTVVYRLHDNGTVSAEFGGYAVSPASALNLLLIARFESMQPLRNCDVLVERRDAEEGWYLELVVPDDAHFEVPAMRPTLESGKPG